jgi:hypothetical protein
LSMALLIALSVVSSSTARAQVECLGECEAQLASCLRNSGPGSPSPENACIESYEACVDACLGASAALMG